MGNCCGGKPTITELLRDKMKNITLVFPTMTFAVLLLPDGDIITALPEEVSTVPDDLLTSISAFKKIANAFGSALQQQDCPSIHIRGKTSVFSCYDIDRHLLAFYSDASPLVLEGVDTGSIDESMGPVISEIKSLLDVYAHQNKKKPKRKRR